MNLANELEEGGHPRVRRERGPALDERAPARAVVAGDPRVPRTLRSMSRPPQSTPARERDPFFAELARALDASRTELFATFGGDTTGNAGALAAPFEYVRTSARRRNAAAYDRLLSQMFIEMEARASDRSAWDGVLFAAVGSYGRGAVALRSDIDVRLVSARPDRATAVADAILYPLWDMGISVGHQVATIDELLEAARMDLPTATSLLDMRRIAGSAQALEGSGCAALQALRPLGDAPLRRAACCRGRAAA